MAQIRERFKNAWNAFLGRDPTLYYSAPYGISVSPFSRAGMTMRNERSIITMIYNQISVDVSQVNINHVQLNKEGKFESILDTTLNRVLTKDANLDQTGRSLIRDATMTLLEQGVAAIFPFLTDVNPYNKDDYKILKARVGKIVEWFPEHVKIEIYNEKIGRRQYLVVEKKMTAIVENPFYATMNEPNSTLQRLIRVLTQLDRLNDQNSAGKMDLIIQLPFTLKDEGRVAQAEKRRKTLESQMTNSQYGIGYIDGTEKVIQLNRPVENNLWEQAKDLTEQLFSQLGMAPTIFNGTADEQTMLNYQNRTLEPILCAMVEEMERKWLSQEDVSKLQAIRFFKDPFKLVPVAKLAEIVDKFTRNEIMSSNEFRSVLGYIPSKDPKADQLINSNLNHPDEAVLKHAVYQLLTYYAATAGKENKNA